MHVPRFLVAVALCFFFLAGFGCVSFSSTEFAIEFLLVSSAIFRRVAFLVASVALFSASALCALVLSPIPSVGVDHHGSVVGGRSSLVRFSPVPEFLPSKLVGFNLTKPFGELRICAHFKDCYDEEIILHHVCDVGREPFVLFFGDKLGHVLPDRFLAVEYSSPSVC